MRNRLIQINWSRPPEWCSGLGVTTDPGSIPVSSELGKCLAERDFLVPLRSSDSLLGAGGLQADFSPHLNGVSSDTLVRLASGLSEPCVKKQCGLAGSCFGGRMALVLRLSRVRRGVAAMGQGCNYQLDVTKLGRKRDKSTTNSINWSKTIISRVFH